MILKFHMHLVGLLFVLSTQAQAYTEDRSPQLMITAKDASHLHQIVTQNSWFKKFAQTNTYRGLLLRMSPVLNQLGSEYKDSWKGTLLDFVFQNLMRGRAISLGHVAQKYLVSPMGMIIHDLSPTEVSILRKLIAQFPKNGKADGITPIEIQRQVFATKLTSQCFFIARDPKVIGSLSPYCNISKSLKSDARIRVYMDEAFPGAWPSIKKIAQVKKAVDLYFNWDATESRYLPKNALVRTYGNTQSLRGGSGAAELLKALPSDSLLAVTANVADFGSLSNKAVSAWITDPKRSKRARQITYVLMPGRNKTFSAILVPYEQPSPEDMKSLGELFNETSYVEVKFSHLCGSYIALSNEQAAIDKIKTACSSKGASLASADHAHRKNFAAKNMTAAVFVNLGVYFASAMEMGRESLAVNEKSKLFLADKNLLAELPVYSFSGTHKDNLINMKASY